MKPILIELQAKLDLAVEDAKHWDDVLEVVVELFKATGALLPPSNPQFRGLWMAGTKEMKIALVEYLADNWHQKDPREGVLKLMLEHGYATDDDVFTDRPTKAKHPFYRDFLRPHNFGNVCVVRILTPNGYWPLTIHFGNDHPPLTNDDIILIKTIQPMFEAAAKRADEVAHKRIHAFAEFFKESKSEVFIFDADGNQCLSVDHTGRIKSVKKLNNLLPSLISTALVDDFKSILASDPNKSLSNAYQFSEDDEMISVLVIQIPPSVRHFFSPFKACAIRCVSTDTTATKHTKLRRDFSLTANEINIVELLASGNTSIKIADLLNVKPASIRQRLKGIFQKTVVNSQVELIALYARL